MAEKPVHEQVQDLLNSWNKPYTNHMYDLVVGAPVPEGDTRATMSVPQEAMNHNRNPGADNVDAERMFTDDGEDDDDVEEPEDYADEDVWTFAALKTEIDKRNAARDDDDDHISKGGSANDLRARLIEDDENDDEEDEEDDEE